MLCSGTAVRDLIIRGLGGLSPGALAGAVQHHPHADGPGIEYRVPAFDGAEDGEEFQCAQAIDSLPGLKHWIRNVARDPASFWLPTATDRFYPDFVAQLDDARLLVVEYKGAYIAGGPDTAEKRTIGELWGRKSDGKGLFLIVEKEVDGMDMRRQVMLKTARRQE